MKYWEILKRERRMSRWFIFIFLILIFTTIYAKGESELEKLTKLLKGKKITVDILEKEYSCLTLETVINSAIKEIGKQEEIVKRERKMTRKAALLPKFTAWSKYKNDEKLYLYQQNNISVGKDYITVGPDDNNATLGNIDTFEVGGRVQFDFSRLMYNPDTIRYNEHLHKIGIIKMEIIERVTYAYYHSAVLNALNLNNIKVPPTLLIPAEINSKKMKMWFKNVTGKDLDNCGEEEE
jgi:hypothetical protein